MLDIIKEEKLCENASEVGSYFKEKLISLAKKYPEKIKEVRGMGLMLGVEYKNSLSKTVNAKLFENKILCGSTATTLRILPPLIITKENVDKFIEILDNITATL